MGQQNEAQEDKAMERLKDFLEGCDTLWVSPKSTVREAVKYLCDNKIGAVLVKVDDEAVGVFSERDLMHRVINQGLNPDEVLVEEVMSRNPITIHVNDDINLAKALMHMNKVRHLLVVGKEGEVVGLLSVRDLMEHDLAASADLIHQLNDKYYERAYAAKWRISSNRVIVETYHPDS
ncbi:MAG TPA: CBS domain-containing protein [Candidatus Hydrogenedentes bacterium]|nr:CBS domain-containing protein [Candidatus Hydrogenedentota bacterium]